MGTTLLTNIGFCDDNSSNTKNTIHYNFQVSSKPNCNYINSLPKMDSSIEMPPGFKECYQKRNEYNLKNKINHINSRQNYINNNP